MELSFVMDCLFDLVNESDLLNVGTLDCHKNTLTFTADGQSVFCISVTKVHSSSAIDSSSRSSSE